MDDKLSTYVKVSQPIHYIIVFGERGAMGLPMVPPAEFSHPFLRFFGHLPQSLLHFAMGIDFYGHTLENHLLFGYDVTIVYADSFDTFDLHLWDKGDIFIYLLCTEDLSLEARIQKMMDRCATEDSLWMLAETRQVQWHLKGNIVRDEKGLWDWLIERFYRYYVQDTHVSVPMYAKELVSKEYGFSATRPNRLMLNSIAGNWFSHLKLDEKTLDYDGVMACQQCDTFARQQMLLEQLKGFQYVERLVAEQIKEIRDVEDSFHPSLILAMPYNSREIRKIVKDVKIPEYLLARKDIITTLFDYEHTRNYTIGAKIEMKEPEEVLLFGKLLTSYIQPRYSFTDFVAMLHASVRFSPYLRLPTLGNNISMELSFVGKNNMSKLSTGKSVKQVIEKIGRKLVDLSLLEELASAIDDRGSQIVALSDLPVEWMMFDGVPLAFTHDVCRLPELPLTSMLAQYMESRFAMNYFIPRDILKKTLVVFGCEEEAFKKEQINVIELQKVLGFTIRTCLSVKEFEDAVKEVQPDLLIVDTHGGIDDATRHTYLVFGDEKLDGDYVVKHQIAAKLVFLSACCTFPTFNTVSTIANAFFEAGAYSVTTSYLPIPIPDSTILYIRLLNMLNVAVKNGVHCNWLSFVSHIMRTSYVQEPIWQSKDPLTDQDRNFLTLTAANLMIYRKRKEIYKNIIKGEFAKRRRANYENILPNYLLYSTLGRADLIRFESYAEKNSIINQLNIDNRLNNERE